MSALLLLAFAVGPWYVEEPLPPGAVARLGSSRFRLCHEVHTGTRPILSPNGRTFACATRHGPIALIDSRNGVVFRLLPDTIRCDPLRFVADGRKLLLRTDEGHSLYDLASGSAILPPEGELWEPASITPDGRYIVALEMGESRGIGVRDLRHNRVMFHEAPLRNPPFVDGVSPDGRTLVTVNTGGSDTGEGLLQLWDANTGKERRRVQVPFCTRPPVFSPDGNLIFLVSGSAIAACEARSGLQRWRVNQPGLDILSTWTTIVVSPNGKHVVLAHSDGLATVRDVATGREVGRVEVHGHTDGIAYDPAGKLIAWRVDGTILRVDRLQADPDPGGPEVHQGPIHALRFDPTGWFLHSLDENAVMATWDVRRRALVRSFDHHRRVEVDLFDLLWSEREHHDTEPAWEPDGYPGRALRGVASFSPRGDRLVIPTATGPVVFDTRTGRELAALPGLREYRRKWYTAFVTDGACVVSCPRLTTNLQKPHLPVLVGDTRSGEAARLLVALGAPSESDSWGVTDAAVSPDGNVVALVAQGNFARECFARNVPLQVLRSNTTVRTVMFDGADWMRVVIAPDSRTALLVGYNGQIHARDLLNGRSLGRFHGYVVPETLPAFSPDGRTFAAAFRHDEGTTVRVYEWAARAERCRFVLPHGGVTALALSPDGRTLATGHDDGLIILWSLDAHPYRPRPHIPVSQLRPARPVRPTPPQVRLWIINLGSNDYARRTSAEAKLAAQRHHVEPALSEAAGKGDLEVCLRARRLLAALGRPTRKEISHIRYVEVLERSRELGALERLANGNAASVLTREAKAALKRLAR